MPWHLPADLAHFKAGHPGQAGTDGAQDLESIGRPLPGAETWSLVVTQDSKHQA